MKKKLLALLLAAVMSVSALAGCGKENDKNQDSEKVSEEAKTEETPEIKTESNFHEEGYPIVDEPVTLSVMWAVIDGYPVIDPQDMPCFQMLEEMTNVKLEFEIVKSGDWSQKLSLMFATEEYPDIIFNGPGCVLDLEDYGVDQGLLIPLDDLIEKYMPNYTSRIAAEDSDPTEFLASSDGKTYTLGYMKGGNLGLGEQAFINETWLNELNLEMPKTIDDLTGVLRAFKADGKLPILENVSTSQAMLSLFGIPGSGYCWMYIDDNKEVKFIPEQEGFRECMNWLHLCYEEGLLDADFFSEIDHSVMQSKASTGNAGFIMETRLLNIGYEELIGDMTLWMPEEEVCFNRTTTYAVPCAAITSTCEYPEIAIRLMDAMLELEIQWTAYVGPQNDPIFGWDYNEDGLIEMYEYMDDPDYDEAMSEWDFMNVNFFMFMPPKFINETSVMEEATKEKIPYVEAYEEAGYISKYPTSYLGQILFTKEESDALALKYTDISTLMDEYYTVFIKDGVTEANWSGFTAALDKIGIEDFVTLYQNRLAALDIE